MKMLVWEDHVLLVVPVFEVNSLGSTMLQHTQFAPFPGPLP